MDMAVAVSPFRYSCGGRSLEPSPNPWMGPGWDVQQYSSQAMAPLQPFAITWATFVLRNRDRLLGCELYLRRIPVT